MSAPEDPACERSRRRRRPRTVARVRGKADPGPVDVARALPVAYGVAVLLIGMSALLLYADIVNPVSIL